MNDDRVGIELLERVVEQVAGSLPRPRARARARRPIVLGLAAAVVLAAILAGIRLAARRSGGQDARPPIDVLALRLGGRDVRARVIDSAQAGSIVVVAVPGEQGGSRPGEAVR